MSIIICIILVLPLLYTVWSSCVGLYYSLYHIVTCAESKIWTCTLTYEHYTTII